MVRFSSAVAVLTVVCALACSPAALAQSAGDEQYSDPLAPTQQRDAPRRDTQQSQTQSDPAPAAEPTTPAPAETDAGIAQQTDENPSPAATAAPKQLPQTGFSVLLLVAAGGPMLIGGIALARISARPAPAGPLRLGL